MDPLMILAAIVFFGFGSRALYLLLWKEEKKDLLLTVAMWGLALLAWGLYLTGKDEKTSLVVMFFGLLTFLLSVLGLFSLAEENPSEFGKEL
ncbi:hypothetical protein [Thermococcus sp.]